MKKIAIMQPYFCPYIGYFQLMNLVDEMVIYDDVKYTKKGWINRNRILVNNKDHLITLPLRNDSDYLKIKERYLAESWSKEKLKIFNRIKEAYKNAPYFKNAIEVIERIINYNSVNLFDFIFNSILEIKNYLHIKTPLIISSSIPNIVDLKAEEKVIGICKALNADVYINPIGGLELYKKENFKKNNIELLFLKTSDVIYKQFNNEFVPNLSIIDVMMFNSKDEIKNMLDRYELV